MELPWQSLALQDEEDQKRHTSEIWTLQNGDFLGNYYRSKERKREETRTSPKLEICTPGSPLLRKGASRKLFTTQYQAQPEAMCTVIHMARMHQNMSMCWSHWHVALALYDAWLYLCLESTAGPQQHSALIIFVLLASFFKDSWVVHMMLIHFLLKLCATDETEISWPAQGHSVSSTAIWCRETQSAQAKSNTLVSSPARHCGSLRDGLWNLYTLLPNLPQQLLCATTTKSWTITALASRWHQGMHISRTESSAKPEKVFQDHIWQGERSESNLEMTFIYECSRLRGGLGFQGLLKAVEMSLTYPRGPLFFQVSGR